VVNPPRPEPITMTSYLADIFSNATDIKFWEKKRRKKIK